MSLIKNEELFKLLSEAELLAEEFTGGFSNHFLSAEEFCQALKESIGKLRQGDKSQIESLYNWFAPTSCWDDFIRKDGEDIGNKIFEMLSKIYM